MAESRVKKRFAYSFSRARMSKARRRAEKWEKRVSQAQEEEEAEYKGGARAFIHQLKYNNNF
jgi:hypothetical protein